MWDGRAASLEEQALGPIQSVSAMNMPIERLVERLISISAWRKTRAYALLLSFDFFGASTFLFNGNRALTGMSVHGTSNVPVRPAWASVCFLASRHIASMPADDGTERFGTSSAASRKW